MPRFNPLRKLASCALTSLLLAAPTQAQTLVDGLDDILKYEFLPGWRGDDGSHMAALRLELASGWKTYWRAPDASGIPTRVRWQSSRNLKTARVIWPHPQVFREHGNRAIGYTGKVILPFHLRAHTDGAIEFTARVSLAVCDTICVPVTLGIETRLLAGSRKPDPDILKALDQQAKPAPEAGFGKIRCDLATGPNGYRLRISAKAPAISAKAPALVMESHHAGFWFSEPVVELGSGQMQARIDQVSFGGGEVTKKSLSEVNFSLITSDRFVDLGPCTED